MPNFHFGAKIESFGQKTVPTMKKASIYVLAVALCLAVGYMASLFQADALAEWYPTLDRSRLTPPDIAFPIVWGVLYVCMGISLGESIRKHNRRVILPWALQLAVNFLWSIFFFYLRNPLLGMVDILLLDILVVWYMVVAARSSRTAVWLFVPYIAWLLLATYLNGYICINNP